MNKDNAVKSPNGLWNTILLGAAAFLLVLAVVSAPEPAFQATLQALKLWWNIVFPSLLPFLVLVEILIAYGWAHGVGVLLDPMMKKIFKLPGTGGWVLITGMTAGFPAGAQAAAGMHKQGELRAVDAGRLAALAHFCNPMTILVVIGTGLLHKPEAGYLLLMVHWISGLLAAWTFSLFSKSPSAEAGKQGAPVDNDRMNEWAKRPILRRAASAALDAHRRDGRSFGKLLGESVTRSVQTLMMTGGFILFFAVITRVLTGQLLPQLPPYLVPGLLEAHLAAQSISSSAFQAGALQLAVLSAALAWSGISAHLQSLSLMREAGLSWRYFMAKRFLHSMLAFLITLAIWKPVSTLSAGIVPAFRTEPLDHADTEQFFNFWSGLPSFLQVQGMICLLLIAAFWLFSRLIGRYPR
ncbi:MAG: nucleoside recognition protein [Paenibacillus lautus]|jgi:sporulation integral membrane protein YlbJ|uniref:nucleoside recognition domain-containing protein n=1 Tax=Paenibacillus lautus TaxID=1401 RepID=UPI0026EB7C0B|nr:nucleoside recognition domain-containing protein [Paenibacillus lautus]MCI1775768.1 nucleoside recognition protein [Paenibacillus lautus]